MFPEINSLMIALHLMETLFRIRQLKGTVIPELIRDYCKAKKGGNGFKYVQESSICGLNTGQR
jgi:hypothetical protein